MRRILGALAVAGALSAATAVDLVLAGQPTRAPAQRAASVRPPASDPTVVRRVAAIARGQADMLRRELARCSRRRPQQARTRCEQMALAHVAAGAKMNGIILRAAGGRACPRLAARLAGLTSTLAFFGVEGTRSTPWPDHVSADARAALRIARRIRHVASPGACVPGMDGPRV